MKHVRNWLMPQLNKDSNDYIFQQDGSPGHYKKVRGYLNRNLPQRWIGRTGKEDDALMRWPPQSPDLTPRNFFFWGFMKDNVSVPPIPANLQIFATVSLLLWLWSIVICWHACGTKWTIAYMSAVLPKVDTLSICKICKKNLESFSLYRPNNYHDPLSSLFVANFKIFHGLMNNSVI